MVGAEVLGRDSFGAQVFRTERVDLPGRSGAVIVREMSAGDAMSFHAAAENNFGGEPAALWLVQRCTVDGDGERLFQSPTDAGACLTREEFIAINGAVLRVNGMDGDAEKKPDAHIPGA